MRNISLEDFGFNNTHIAYRKENHLEEFSVGRVILEHRERYIVLTENGEFESELLGNFRYTAQSTRDLPAVGDWVAVKEYDLNKGLIHSIYPRTSILERQAVGKTGEKQIIATNIDYGLIVQSLNRDYSINRLERYMTICNESKINPIIVLSKIDLVDRMVLDELLLEVKERLGETPILSVSNKSGEGLNILKSKIEPGKTYCFLGSSGVGKSSLINRISGKSLMSTKAISKSIDRGRHVTTHRELIILNSGGVLIDNPGMREVGIADSSTGLQITYEQIYTLGEQCKFNDCKHINEKGCAVSSALETGALNRETYINYMKLVSEQEHYSLTVSERREKDRKFGKLIKNVVAQKKNRF